MLERDRINMIFSSMELDQAAGELLNESRLPPVIEYVDLRRLGREDHRVRLARAADSSNFLNIIFDPKIISVSTSYNVPPLLVRAHVVILNQLTIWWPDIVRDVLVLNVPLVVSIPNNRARRSKQ